MKSVPSPVVHGRINCLSAGTPMCSKVEKRRWEAHGFAAPGGASATSHIYIYIYMYVYNVYLQFYIHMHLHPHLSIV